MYVFHFVDGRVITSNDPTLPKRLKIQVKLVFKRSNVTGKFVLVKNLEEKC